MKPVATSSKAGVLVATAFIFCYLAGYGIIRKDCEAFGGSYFIVPSYLKKNETLRSIYRPCFRMESCMSGNQFTMTPWGTTHP